VNISSASFLDLPFTKLFRDYITDFNKLDSFFETNPFSDSDIQSRIDGFTCVGDRKKIVDYLKEYNSHFDADGQIFQTIEKFNDEEAFAVVTGQQLILYGGPLFTIYKILTAISYAKRWEKKFNRPFVPVFWMADEDHDYEEIATLGIPVNDEIKNFFLEPESGKVPRVAEIKFGKNLEPFRKALEEAQFDTDFSEQLWNKLDSFYQEGNAVGQAFGKLILHLFGKHGVVLAGTNSSFAKEMIVQPMQKSVEQTEENYDALTSTSDKLLKAGYHNQVHLQHSNLFWIDDEKNRIKISTENGKWSADGDGKNWNQKELIDDIEKNSDRFSPNVFLRPVVQNYLLPAIAYVAGPGETAYYAQMKTFYRQFGLKMPLILPRFGATILESGIDRVFRKLPFSVAEYNQRIEDLESAYIGQSDSPDIEAIFQKWKNSVNTHSEQRIQEIEEIDPTLKGSSERAKTIFFTELDKLKGKAYRSVKEQEKTQLNRIRKIQNNLFPNGNLQEREVAFIYFMNKYGPDIWDRFLEIFDNEVPDSHKIIRL
jgi:bacillithiol synthase